MAKLTKRALEAMDPPAKGKQSFLWDSELRGFGVRLLPSGLQTFILQYRNTANKERRINLGRFGKIENHPSRGARKLAGKRKTRRLSVAEIKKLGMAMRHAERNGEHPVGLAIVRLLLLTGFRISEGQAMQRAWIHADAGYISFPDTKGDAQVRAIGPAAAKLIASQPVQQNCPYVFPSDVGDGHFTASKACLARLCASVGIEGVTPHTLRHTFGSVAGDLGFSELTIRALLGHAAQSVTQGYVHIDEALKLAVTRTCDEIASLLDSSEEKAFLNAEEFQAA